MGLSAPKVLHVFGQWLKIRFTSIGIYTDYGISSVGKAHLIESGLFQAERFRGPRFAE
jgi:hypothetical protein